MSAVIELLIYGLVVVFGAASYLIAVRQMLSGSYRPNMFSRLIWLMLAINSLAAVVLSGGSMGSIVLSVVMLTGSLAIFAVGFKRGAWQFSYLEAICVALLVLSGVVWIFYSAPFVNLLLTRVIHLIGGLPTIKRVWKNPESESSAFWLLFIISSFFAIFAEWPITWAAVILPVYYVVFDGIIFLLAVRKRSVKRKVKPVYAG